MPPSADERYLGTVKVPAAHATMNSCASPNTELARPTPAVQRAASVFSSSDWQELPVMLKCWYALLDKELKERE